MKIINVNGFVVRAMDLPLGVPFVLNITNQPEMSALYFCRPDCLYRVDIDPESNVTLGASVVPVDPEGFFDLTEMADLTRVKLVGDHVLAELYYPESELPAASIYVTESEIIDPEYQEDEEGI